MSNIIRYSPELAVLSIINTEDKTSTSRNWFKASLPPLQSLYLNFCDNNIRYRISLGLNDLLLHGALISSSEQDQNFLKEITLHLDDVLPLAAEHVHKVYKQFNFEKDTVLNIDALLMKGIRTCFLEVFQNSGTKESSEEIQESS